MSELSELFARDPLHLTQEDRCAIVERMRQARAQFELGIKAPVAERKKKPQKVDLLADLGLLDLQDLNSIGLGDSDGTKNDA
jgi:hypothetical protein